MGADHMTNEDIPVDDPRAFLDKYKRDTPEATILAMLAEPTLSIDCKSERYAGGFVEIRVSGKVFNTYQLLDALKRYRDGLVSDELRRAVAEAAFRVSDAAAEFKALAEKLPDDMQRAAYDLAYGKAHR